MAIRIVRPETAFAAPRIKPVKKPEYLAFIRSLPCIVTKRMPVEAAHLSFANPSVGHFGRGKSQKAPDRWALPLSLEAHRDQHKGSERKFWQKHGIDPHLVALTLWGVFCEHGTDGKSVATNMIITGNMAGIGGINE